MLTPWLLERIYRPLVRRAARQILQGRTFDPAAPERGRWSRRDIDVYNREVWKRVKDLLPIARLPELPTLGSRHNVFLATVSTAAFQVLLERGTPRDYAFTLIGDVAWKIYSWMLNFAVLPFRITTRDPQRRINRALSSLMFFPFSAAGRPGYEVKSWVDADGCHTHWTHCPPQQFVRDLVQSRGDRGEIEAFYRSWCLFDWPAADLLAGDGETGHYERPHTMSRGDEVCDMCWHARQRGGVKNCEST